MPKPWCSIPDFVSQVWRKNQIFLQNCETKSRTESQDLRLGYGHHNSQERGLTESLPYKHRTLNLAA